MDTVSVVKVPGVITTVTTPEGEIVTTVAGGQRGLTGPAGLPVDILATAPASPTEGYTYYNTTDHKLWYWNGTAWVDVTAGGGSTDAYCIEFDGTPKTVDIGQFFPAEATVLGDCFYELWTCILPGGGSGKYDFSDGYGGAHAMLRNPVNGNFTLGAAVSGATNATPIAITTVQDHPFATGDSVRIAGVLGNTAANGVFTITKTGAKSFTLNSSVGSGTYTSGGAALGPFVDGKGVIGFGADDVAYENQWHHSATGLDCAGTVTGVPMAIAYYDGVPVGAVLFTGTRVSPQPSYNGHGYIGGSDHSNAKQRIWQYRIFEGGLNPRVPPNPILAFSPELLFGGQWGAYRASFLCDFSSKGQIADKGQGFPVGTLHSGVPKGVANGVFDGLPTDPPDFVSDTTIPDPFNPVQPAGKVYTPALPPAGALVFDSIQRKNSTLAFNGIGGIGATESGSKGILTWQQALQPQGYYPFGILNEQFVYLGHTSLGFGGCAWVEVGQTDQRIEVSRKAWSTYNCGVGTSILFRYKDANNYNYAITLGQNGTFGNWGNQWLYVAKVVAGVETVLKNVVCPASWTTLKVKTKSNGSYEVLCDATSVASGSDSANASETKSGIIVVGCPANYGQGTGLQALSQRWRNFTIFDNP